MGKATEPETEAPRTHYVIQYIAPPLKKDLDMDIEWICRCFGFLEPKDKERTCAKIFRMLLESSREGISLSSDEVAGRIGTTRGTVVHHLNRLIRAGLVIRERNRYRLRMRSLGKTIEEVEKDIIRVLNGMKDVAFEIDDELKLPHR